MNDRSDIGRWALEDEQLEELLAGVSPDAAGLAGNPVAEFFADARLARGVAQPDPSPSLRQLFATGSPFGPPQTHPPEQAYDAGPSDDPTLPFGVGPAHDVTEVVGLKGSILGGPPPDAAGPGVVQPDLTEAVPFRRSLDEYAEAEPHYRVYRASPIEAAIAVLRPTGTKLLMAVALVVVSAAGVEALGIYDFPLLSTGRGQGDTFDIAAGQGNLEDQAKLPTTVGSGDSTGGTESLPAPAVLIEDGDSPSDPTSTTPQAPATTVAQTTTPTIVEPETTSLTTTTTTAVTGSTETVTTDTTVVETTPYSGPSDTTAPTSSSVVTTPTTLVVPIAVGTAEYAPGDIPAGTYSAVVSQDSTRCTVRVFRGSGGETSIFNRSPGESISFTLADGDGVQLGTGCPAVFTVS